MALDLVRDTRYPSLGSYRSPEDEYGPFGGFIASTVSSIGPEFVGLEPSEAISAYRGEHPFASIASQLLGFGGSYAALTAATGGLGSLGLVGKIPRGAKAATSILKGLEKAGPVLGPITAAGAREVIRFAPVEAARYGLASAVGNPDRVLEELPVNLAVVGAAGSVFRGIGMALPFPNAVTRGEAAIADAFPEYRLTAYPQERLRQLYAIREREALAGNLTPSMEEAFDTAIRGRFSGTKTNIPGLETEILKQSPPANVRAYLQKTTREDVDRRFLNEVMKPTKGVQGKDFITRQLHDDVSTGGFPKFSNQIKKLSKYTADMEELGGKYWRSNVQYPRVIYSKNARGTARLNKLFENGDSIGDLRYFREQESGMYLAFKKLSDSEFLAFKTDDLSKFVPEAGEIATALGVEKWVSRPDYLGSKELEQAGPLAIDIKRLFNDIPRYMPIQGAAKGRIIDEMSKAVVATRPGQEASRVTRFFKEQFKTGFAPGLHAMSGDYRAVRMYALGRAAMNMTHATSIQEFGGKVSRAALEELLASKKVTPFKLITRKILPTKGGIVEKIRNLSDKDLIDFFEIQADWKSVAEIAKGDYSKELKQFVQALNRLDKKKVNQVLAAQQFVGKADFAQLERHLMMSRTWRGDFRVRVVDSKGNYLGMGSGFTRAEAVQDAEAVAVRANQLLAEDRASGLLTKAEGEVRALTDEVYVMGRDEDLLALFDPKLIKAADTAATNAFDRAYGEIYKQIPGRFRKRSGLIGSSEFHRVPTHDDLESIVFNNLVTSNKYVGSRIRDKFLADEMATLRAERPTIGKDLQRRFARLDGISGPFTKSINKYSDAALGWALGRNSASKISGFLSNALFRLTLTAGDLGFPTVNAMTFLQTVLPEVSLLRTAPEESLAKYYSYSLINSRKGLQEIAHLSPGKISNQAWREIGRAATGADKELFENLIDASNRGIISPRFVEEYLGELRDRLAKLGHGGENWLRAMNAADSYLAAKSEELSRLHAFLTGRIVGRDIFNLEDRRLFHFAEQFTDRTMFIYNQAGRAQLFTGPIGSVVGLFKNWPLHYLGNLSGYVGQGFRYGNWKPLAWSMFGTGTIAGLGGIPFYFVADGASRLFSDESLMDNLYAYMGYADSGPFAQRGIDSIYYGLPALGGITFQGRAEAPASDIVRDINQLGSVIAFDRAKLLYDAGSDLIDSWIDTGVHPGRNRLGWSKLARAMLPRTMYKWMQRTENGAMKSLSTGNPLISNVTIPEHISYTLGITPIDLQRTQDVSSAIWNQQKDLSDKITSYGRLIADRRLDGDYQGAHDLYRKAFLEDNLPMDRVAASALSYLRKRERISSIEDLSARRVAEAERIYGPLR